MTSSTNVAVRRPMLQLILKSTQMEKFAEDEETSDESDPAEKTYRYALELPYSKQNYNFKSSITRLGRDLIIIGLVLCLLRTGYVSQCLGNYMTQSKEVKEQSSWMRGWFSQSPLENRNTLSYRIKTRLQSISKRLPVFGYALEICSWAGRIFKRHVQNSIGWLALVEDHLPDVGESLLAIGAFLFLLGSTLILRDNWVSSSGPLAITAGCTQCLAEESSKMAAGTRDEEIATKEVELNVPIFKFIKVYPFHKKFSGTKDFSLNSAKMRLIIQFNKTTQTFSN